MIYSPQAINASWRLSRISLILPLMVFKSVYHVFLCFFDPSTTLAILAPKAGGFETCRHESNQHVFREKDFTASIWLLLID